MTAEIKPAFSYERKRLADIIPLKTPFTFLLAPSHICNLKCSYCSQSNKRDELVKDGFNFKVMDYDVFLKFAEQLKLFPNKLKLINTSGMGEPLMNKRLPEMISHLNKMDVAERIEIFTNATLLTKEKTDALVSAGLTRLRVSLQGLSSEKYKETSGVDIDFNELLSNLTYFYKARKQCKLYIKVIDTALEAGEEDKFYNMFENICDEMYIEKFVPYQVSMGDYDSTSNTSTTVYGDKLLDADVCPEPFFNWQIDVDGDVYPCCPCGLPKSFKVGNVNDSTLFEMWNGEKARQLRLQHLKMERKSHYLCSHCQVYLSKLTAADRLDDDAKHLIPLFENIEKN